MLLTMSMCFDVVSIQLETQAKMAAREVSREKLFQSVRDSWMFFLARDVLAGLKKTEEK